MERRRKNTKAKARTPTAKETAQIKNSGYSEGGASRTSSILKSYLPIRSSARSDIDANLPLLRNRSADQAINTPIGAAAIQTSSIHTIGAGLKVFPRIRYQELGLSHEEARAWQKKARREFDLWAMSKHSDLYRRNNFYDLQDMAYVAYLVDGDAFALFRRKPPTRYMPYSLRLQILEGNRISNPMDAMTYLTLKSTKLPRNRVLGLGGLLDSSRFKYYLAQELHKAGIPASLTDVDGMVVGGHNDKTMVPLVSYAAYRGIPITKILSQAAIDEAVAQTKKGGATLTGLIGTSAWYAPGAAVATLVGTIVTDARKLIPCCVYLDGEYGEHDLCIGVPVILGAKGVERIVDVALDGKEKEAFEASVKAARETNAHLAGALA